MGDVRDLHDFLHVVAHGVTLLVQIVASLFAVFAFAGALAVVLRAFEGGSRSRAAASRARIEAEMERRVEDSRGWASVARGRAAERALRRRLASVEVVIRESPIAGERAAAEGARQRLLTQLGENGGPDAASPEQPTAMPVEANPDPPSIEGR